jgi:hypothetical protein
MIGKQAGAKQIHVNPHIGSFQDNLLFPLNLSTKRDGNKQTNHYARIPFMKRRMIAPSLHPENLSRGIPPKSPTPH